ncbi:MAG: peroxiredoxin family protein [bacterium]
MIYEIRSILNRNGYKGEQRLEGPDRELEPSSDGKTTGCPSSLTDIPNWRRLPALESDTLYVLGISQADSDHTQNLLSSYVLDFEVVIDPVGKMKERYKCGSVPEKVLIDQKGRVVYVETEAVPHKETGKLEQRWQVRGLESV